MKDRLTAEQSNRLIELGVDPSKASESDIYGRKPIYTLSDLLELLPKEIYNGRIKASLTTIADNDGWYAGYDYYDLTGASTDNEKSIEAPDLIDCLYELLIWCVKEKHLKL